MKVISRARILTALGIAASLSMAAYPCFAKDIVGFTDQVAKQANPSTLLILHNKEAWTNNTIDTITARLAVDKFKYDIQGYNQGDRVKDIARGINWQGYGAVICMGQNMDCDWIKSQAEQKGFEGSFYNAFLEKR
jgi:hypothetical protein